MEGNNNEVIVDTKNKKEETKAMIQAISAVVVIAIIFIYFMYFHKSPTTEENTTNETNVTEINETTKPVENITETNITKPETNETEENTTLEENTTTTEMKEFKYDFVSPCLEDLDEPAKGFNKYSILVNNLKISNEAVQFIYDFDELKSATTIFINNKTVSQRIEKERITKMCVYKNSLIVSYEKPDGYSNDIIGYNNKLRASFEGLYTFNEEKNILSIKYATYVNAKDRIANYYEDDVDLVSLETKNIKKEEIKCNDYSKESIPETEKDILAIKVCTNNK